MLKMPELPSHEAALPKEAIKTLGPVRVAVSDKQKRIEAANKYLIIYFGKCCWDVIGKNNTWGLNNLDSFSGLIG